MDFFEFSPGFQYLLALALTCGVGLMLAFVGLLFFRKGPWVPGFYVKGTSITSIEQVRERDPTFDSKKWLEENPIPRVKPWGAFIVDLDLQQFKKYIPCLKRTKKELEDEKSQDFDAPPTERKLLSHLQGEENGPGILKAKDENAHVEIRSRSEPR